MLLMCHDWCPQTVVMAKGGRLRAFLRQPCPHVARATLLAQAVGGPTTTTTTTGVRRKRPPRHRRRRPRHSMLGSPSSVHRNPSYRVPSSWRRNNPTLERPHCMPDSTPTIVFLFPAALLTLLLPLPNVPTNEGHLKLSLSLAGAILSDRISTPSPPLTLAGGRVLFAQISTVTTRPTASSERGTVRLCT